LNGLVSAQLTGIRPDDRASSAEPVSHPGRVRDRIIVSRVSSPRWPSTGGCDRDGASGNRERAAGSRHSMGEFVERGTKIAGRLLKEDLE
jgi:hypothetical protein